MRKKIVGLISLLIIISLCMSLSRHGKHRNEIRLRYTIKHAGDSWEKNRTGLLWALSMLGAELPRSSFDRNIKWIDSGTFRLNLDSLGFSEPALDALKLVCDSIKRSHVYRKTGSVELGYFISITLGSSWHYYQITCVPRTYSEFLSLHKFEATEIFPVMHSTVSKRNRFVRSNFTGDILHTAYIAEEGYGSITGNNFTPKEFNVMDVMKNGQLRFMVYDSTGGLLAAADSYFGFSGKPAKCLWCHEINIQSVFEPTDSVPGAMGPVAFNSIIKKQNTLLNEYRRGLNSDVDFSKLQDHTQMELIYINYMEPSLEKLSQEWNVPKEHLGKLLKARSTHVYHEFPFLGDLYHRNEIYNESVYKPGKLPSKIREWNAEEPNFFSFLNGKNPASD